LSRRAGLSLLFDFFVTSQRLRRVLSEGLAGSGMRPDEYAVYGLLFERGPLTATEMADFLGMPLTTVLDYVKVMSVAGHVVRTSHPFDGRAVQLSLNRRGTAAHQRAHARWELVRKEIEGGLSMPIATIAASLEALADSADRTGQRLRVTRDPGSRNVLKPALRPRWTTLQRTPR
jgi:DNA-binding MarR family transcriptional regulator